MNPAYNKTLSLLVEIKSNFPNPGMGGQRGSVDPKAQSNKAQTDPEVYGGDDNNGGGKFMGGFAKGKFIGTSVPKKQPLYKRILKAFMRKFRPSNDK